MIKKKKNVDIEKLLASRQLEDRNKFDDLVSEYPNLSLLAHGYPGAVQGVINQLSYGDISKLSKVEKEALDDAIITHGAKGAALKALRDSLIGGVAGAGLGAALTMTPITGDNIAENAGTFGALGAGLGGIYGGLTGAFKGAKKGRELAERRRAETRRILEEAASFSEKSKEEKLKELLDSRALSKEDRDSILAKYPFLLTPNVIGKIAEDSGLSNYDNLAANEAINAAMLKDAGIGALGGSVGGALLGGTIGALVPNGSALAGASWGSSLGGLGGGLGGAIYGAIKGNKRARKRREEEKRIIKEALLNNSGVCESKKVVQNFSVLKDIKKQLSEINAKIDALGL